MLTILFFLFLIIDLYSATAKISNPIAELVIPIGIASKEAIEIEINTVIVEAKVFSIV